MDSDSQPSQIGPYRLLRRIGQGGMAEVYLGIVYGASGFEKRVAVKMLLRELRGHPEYERILIEEAKLGAQLSHRNLVQVHDLGLDSGTYYLRMDYVDGSDLGRLLRSERPPVDLALLLAEELALALDYVHRASDDSGRPLGLVHRDVSPSNILLSRAGEVKLADFGIAKATKLADITHGQVRKGKYTYMSPEQVEGQRVTAQSDQFAFGVMLMELCCGRRPYDAATVMETLERIREAAAPDLGGLSGRLQELIRRCLRRSPADRFPSATELQKELSHIRRYLAPVSCSDLGAWVSRRLAITDSPSPVEPSADLHDVTTARLVIP